MLLVWSCCAITTEKEASIIEERERAAAKANGESEHALVPSPLVL